MQHHSPASVAATVGVSVALRICPKKSVAHATPTYDRLPHSFWFMSWPLVLASSLHQFSFHSPYCSSYASCTTKTPWWFERKDQVDKSFPVIRSVLLLLLQNLPFLYPRSVNRKIAFLLCTPHVQWFHMNKNLTDWTLSSCALPLPSAKAHQPHVHATDRARAWDTTAAGITFALQLTSRNEPLLYSFPIARRQSPPPGIQTAFHHTGVGGRGRSPFIIYWLVVLTIPYIMEKKKCSKPPTSIYN